jgi:hypothetical protein
MTLFMRAAFAAVLVALSAPSHAAEVLTGRWAADDAACDGGFFTAQSPLVVTSYAVRWQGDSCRIGRMYKAGETIYIQAFCWGAAGERSIPVSLRPHAGRLALTWDRTSRGELRRCQ